MTEHEQDTTAGDDREHPLVTAMAALAATMPDDPYRLDGIRAKAHRLQARRRARRAAAGIAVSAATVATLVAVRSGTTAVSTIVAGAPTTATVSAFPSCAAALAAPAAVQRDVKGHGTITGEPSATAITITLDTTQPDAPAKITAVLSPETAFRDAGATVDRPALTDGERVAFGVVATASGYQLAFLEVHPVEGSSSATATSAVKAKTSSVENAATAKANAQATEPFVKGSAEVVAVQPDSLTLKLRNGPLTGQVINAAAGTDTVYTVGDRKCTSPMLAAGTTIDVLLARTNAGTYTLQQVSFHP